MIYSGALLAGVFLSLGCTSAPPKAEVAPASASGPTAAPEPAASSVTVAALPPSAVPSVAPSASAAPAVADEPLPNVEVKFLGLHVGGGSNDKAEHAPIIHSIEAHRDDFKRCFAKVDDPKKGGSFGIQLLIPGAGGKAEVSHPKNGLKGDAFKDCMVEVYNNIDFDKPKGGVKTNATYSLSFTPH